MTVLTANVYLYPPNGLPGLIVINNRTYTSLGQAVVFTSFDAATAQANGWTPYSPTGASGGGTDSGSGVVVETNLASLTGPALVAPGLSIILPVQSVLSGGPVNLLYLPSNGIVSGKLFSQIGVLGSGTLNVCVDFYWATGTPLTIANYSMAYQFYSLNTSITAQDSFAIVNNNLTVLTQGGAFTTTGVASTFLGHYYKAV